MIMSAGMVTTDDDLFVNGDSSLIMTGGVIDIGDRLVASDNANILLGDGTITVRDDVFLLGDSQMTVDGGLMQVVDKLHFDLVDPIASGKLTINGGIVRSDEYGNAGAGRSLIEINGDGVFQVLQSQLSIAEAVMLIAAGIHITTSELAPLALGASSVVVADFFGQTNLTFTQISIIPEPSAALMILIGLMGLRISGTRSKPG
jgi:hypothetical protein